MDINEAVTKTQRQIDQWARDSQDILSRVIPGLVEQCASLAKRVELAEGYSARLSREVEALQGETAKLRSENDRLRRERTEVADAVKGGVSDIARLASELLGRLKGSEVLAGQQTR